MVGRTQRRIANLLESKGQSVDAEVGLLIAPGETRVLDVAVLVGDAGFERTFFRPDEIELAIEIVSPGSRNADYVDKPALYARLGIGEFWRVDRDEKDIVQVEKFRLDPDRPIPVYVPAGTVSLEELERS